MPSLFAFRCLTFSALAGEIMLNGCTLDRSGVSVPWRCIDICLKISALAVCVCDVSHLIRDLYTKLANYGFDELSHRPHRRRARRSRRLRRTHRQGRHRNYLTLLGHD